ncbi:OprD family outer membrane porin [Acinetobacter sp. MB5]|uniref:OprD family outer membrane porin n=1 Tax=Acinetobacter sp. MB5 TaxID=2069438 RepID=UPI000DD09EE5|nr:OprD family outer membrane porin [Acinetobacter sp. MB5]
MMKFAKILSLSMATICCQHVLADELEDQSLELKLNTRYFSDNGQAHASTLNPNPKTTQYQQSALGAELNYKSAYYDDLIGLDASLYGVVKLADSGTPTVQLLDVRPNGKLDTGFASVGVLAIKAKLGEGNELRIGRQKVDTMLIKSTFNRAVPDTFSGVSLRYQLQQNWNAYAGYYNKWQPRTADKFTSFVTDNNQKINYVALVGMKYKYDRWGLNAEYLNSAHYLKKYGLIADYSLPLSTSRVDFRSGAMFSRNAGDLFKCGAEADLDCIKGQSIENRGQGYFVEATWKKNNWELGAALTKIYGFWIEDNYSTRSARDQILIQDNGTNPFPTSTVIGPDFTNRDELAWMARIRYNWKDYIQGLSTEFKYITGSGAHQSNIQSDVTGKEHFTEFTLAYKIPYLRHLDFRYSYLTYHSRFDRDNLSQKINGMLKSSWHQHRVALTYTYKF